MDAADPLSAFLEAQGLVILDGGLATELETRGHDLSDALWSADLVCRDRDEIGPIRSRVDGERRERLHGIGVDKHLRIPLPNRTGYCGNRKNGPGFVVGGHHRNHRRVGGGVLQERAHRGGRAAVVCHEQPVAAEVVPSDGLSRSPARYLWAMLLARIYEVFPLVCRHCGAEMRIIAFVTETASVTRILQHIGEPTKAPVLSPTLGPTAGLNADGQHNHIWDTVVPTFLHYNLPLLAFGWMAAMTL